MKPAITLENWWQDEVFNTVWGTEMGTNRRFRSGFILETYEFRGYYIFKTIGPYNRYQFVRCDKDMERVLPKDMPKKGTPL
jgi:hypothetical protein